MTRAWDYSNDSNIAKQRRIAAFTNCSKVIVILKSVVKTFGQQRVRG